jgi:hypothetical protein
MIDDVTKAVICETDSHMENYNGMYGNFLPVYEPNLIPQHWEKQNYIMLPSSNMESSQ